MTGQQNLKEELESTKEENEFLVNQIQHLLHQEVENSQKMLKQVERLEDTIVKKDAEYNELQKKLSNTNKIDKASQSVIT